MLPQMRSQIVQLNGKTLKSLLCVVVLTLFVSGCAGGLGRTSGCEGFKPIFVTEGDRLLMTPKTLRQIDDHNTYWEKICNG
jgi:hypothetical protein